MEIKISNVQYALGNKKILNNINTKIKEGKINAIIGANGCGKSTLIKMLNATLYPTFGNILVGTFDIDNDKSLKNVSDLRFNVGIISQFSEEQFFCETVEKEISFGIEFFNYKRNIIDKRINDAIKMVGLSKEYLKRDPFTLSSSEKRKLSLASSLVINPEILVIDEPTFCFNLDERKNLIKILKKIKRRYGKTILLVSQDIDFIHQVADYIFVMDDGQIVFEGDKYDVFIQDQQLKKAGLCLPKIIQFEQLVQKEKNIKLGFRDEINDLIKDILRNI